MLLAEKELSRRHLCAFHWGRSGITACYDQAHLEHVSLKHGILSLFLRKWNFVAIFRKRNFASYKGSAGDPCTALLYSTARPLMDSCGTLEMVPPCGVARSCGTDSDPSHRHARRIHALLIHRRLGVRRSSDRSLHRLRSTSQSANTGSSFHM